MNPTVSRAGFFAFAMTFEAGILILALALGGWMDLRVLPDLGGPWRDVLGGTVAAIPMLLAMIWMVESRNTIWLDIRQVVEQMILPSLRNLRLWQLASLSALAGLGEEALFRGILQTKVAAHLDATLGLILASAAFGLAHALTPGYALLAGGMGLWLGWLYLWTGDLMAPVLCHAVYDFAALCYLLKVHKPSEPGPGPQTSSSDSLR